jgi:hypothetical protein
MVIKSTVTRGGGWFETGTHGSKAALQHNIVPPLTALTFGPVKSLIQVRPTRTGAITRRYDSLDCDANCKIGCRAGAGAALLRRPQDAMRTESAMDTNISASDLRRWAGQCDAQAADPRASGDERERLLKMREALLTLAENQDWLDGRSRKIPESQTAGPQPERAHAG